MFQFSLRSRIKLNNDVEIPILGLGVWQSPPGIGTRDAVKFALESGYRLIDTVRIYGNEGDVGATIRGSGLPRDEIFVTTKVWNSDQGYDSTVRACQESLRRMGLNYLDMFLVHWPVSGLRAETWRAMCLLLKQGKCRAIGVSNYTIHHIQELLELTDVVPAVNQVEFHPFLYQKELLEFCRESKIQLEAYSPLTRGERLDNPKITALAARHNRTPAQVLIRWGLQHSLVLIPKSVRKERILENGRVFDFALSSEEMKTLDSLNEDFRTCWDPSHIP